jgi:hypothetical protein
MQTVAKELKYITNERHNLLGRALQRNGINSVYIYIYIYIYIYNKNRFIMKNGHVIMEPSMSQDLQSEWQVRHLCIYINRI